MPTVLALVAGGFAAVLGVPRAAIAVGPPNVTAANITVTSTGSGTGGAYVPGDTVTVAWDNSATGDNNAGIVSVTADLSQWGLGGALTAYDDGSTCGDAGVDQVWTACGGVSAGSIDSATAGASITATNGVAPTTTADDATYAVDNQAPVVADVDMAAVSHCSGGGGTCIAGDTVDFKWTDPGAGDIAAAVADLSAFGGGAAQALAVDDGGVTTQCPGGTPGVDPGLYCHTLTIASGTVDNPAAGWVLTAIDDAGNGTMQADGDTVSVDNQAPAVTDANIAVSGTVGGGFNVGATVTVTWDSAADGVLDVASATANLSDFGGGAAVAMIDDGSACGDAAGDGVYTACYTIAGTEGIDDVDNRATVMAVDDAGNVGGPTADGTMYPVDAIVPVITSGNISVTSSGSGTGGAYIVGDVVRVVWDRLADGNTDIVWPSADLSAWGGGTADVMFDDGSTCGDAAAGDGKLTVCYTINGTEGIDVLNAEASVTATDDVSNTTGPVLDGAQYAVDANVPAVSGAAITVTGATGPASTFRIGDTVTVEWNNGAGGDNNGAEVVSAVADLSGWGGGAVAMVDDGSACGDSAADDIWTACYVITPDARDTTAAAMVDATDDAGNVGTAGDDISYNTDDQAPAVTAANISVSGATGTGGAFRIGNTVVVSWDNGGGGDNNADLASATADLSAWGGGAAVAMADDGSCGGTAGDGVYDACYTISGAEGIDVANAEASVTATDDADNSTGPVLDGAQYAVDTVAPAVSTGNFGVVGAGSGPGGIFVPGDTVVIQWNDGPTGDNNGAEVVSAAADLSAWGGGATVAMTDTTVCGGTAGDGVYEACYTLVPGAIDTGAIGPWMMATDDAGNAVGASYGATYSVDTQLPTVSDAQIVVTGGSGTGGAFKIGDTVTVAWDDSATGDNNGAEVVSSAADLSAWGGGAAIAMTDTTACGGTAGDGVYEACHTLVSASEDTSSAQAAVTATDDAGNTTTTLDSSVYTADDMEPSVNASSISVSGATGPSGYFRTGDTVTVSWDDSATGDNNGAEVVSAAADLSAWGGGAAIAMTDTTACGGTAGDGVYEACYTLAAAPYSTGNAASVDATDDAGNVMTASDDQTYQIGTVSSGGGGGGGGAASVPTLTVTAPNGGESLVPGNVYVLQWNSIGGSQPYVAIRLSVDGGTTYPTIIAANDPNIGTFRWTVPDVATTAARVKVESKDFVGGVQASDASNADFTILGTQAPAAPEQPLPQQPGMTVDELREEFENYTSATAGEAMEREDADDALPSVAPVDTLVKLANDGNPATDADTTVYYIGLDAKRHPFPTLAMFLSWHKDFSDVKEIDAATLASIPLGKPIMARPGTVWVKIQSDPKVYYVEPGNLLRWIKDETAARALGGETWSTNVIDVDPSLFVQYTPHDTIDLDSLAASWPGGQLVRENESAPTYYVGQDSRRPVDAAGFAKNMFQERFLRTTGTASWLNASVGTFVCDREDGLYSLMH